MGILPLEVPLDLLPPQGMRRLSRRIRFCGFSDANTSPSASQKSKSFSRFKSVKENRDESSICELLLIPLAREREAVCVRTVISIIVGLGNQALDQVGYVCRARGSLIKNRRLLMHTIDVCANSIEICPYVDLVDKDLAFTGGWDHRGTCELVLSRILPHTVHRAQLTGKPPVTDQLKHMWPIILLKPQV